MRAGRRDRQVVGWRSDRLRASGRGRVLGTLSEPRFHIAKAKEATQEASAKASELENTANQAKDAEAERTQIQSALDEANKEIERLRSELEQQKATPPV
jgi:multidrug resistance efflux pump